MTSPADKATDDVRGLVERLRTIAAPSVVDPLRWYGQADVRDAIRLAAATLTSLLERAERAERRAEELADGLMYVTVDRTGCIYTTADEDRAIKLAKDNLAAAIEAERTARERAEARIKELEQALEPFARLGGYIEDETEGFSDRDELDLYLHDFLIHRFKAGDFRRARAAEGE